MTQDAYSGRHVAGGVTGSRQSHKPRQALRALFALILGLGFALGCTTAQPQSATDRAARAQRLIESGNQAYGQGDYRLAVSRYAAAAVVRKDDPAAYYGMGMALGKLGRDEEARAAYQRARDLTQAAGTPIDSAGGPAQAP